MTIIDEAIQLHGGNAVFEASAYGESGDFAPLRKLGLSVEAMDEADEIGTIVYNAMSAEEKAALHWEASRDLHKNKEPVDWDAIDYQIAPRSSDESEAEYHHRRMLGELIQE